MDWDLGKGSRDETMAEFPEIGYVAMAPSNKNSLNEETEQDIIRDLDPTSTFHLIIIRLPISNVQNASSSLYI
jgi:hypothetical protein